MAQLDLLASQPQYRAHLEPAWAALPATARGADGSQASEAVLVGAWGDLVVARRRGYRRIAYLEHGIGQPYGPRAIGYPGGEGRDGVSLFLSPNATAAAADRRRHPEAQVVVVGDPALEGLPQREPGPLTVAISFHWDCRIAPESRSALPHYRAAIASLAQQYPLIGHGHPRAPELGRLWARHGIEAVASWHEVLRRADVYICDNSSTLYEFASTGRGVVVLDAPWFRPTARHGLRFWQAADVGVRIGTPEQLPWAIEQALADPPAVRAAREAALELAYAQPRAGAAGRAAAALLGWLG